MTAAAVCSCPPATSRRSRTRSRVCCSTRSSGGPSPGWRGGAPRPSAACGATGRAAPGVSPPPGYAPPAGSCGVTGRWRTPGGRVLHPVGVAVFRAVRFYEASVGRRALVPDRYFCDTLGEVAGGGGGFWVRVLERLTPAPEIAVFLDGI